MACLCHLVLWLQRSVSYVAKLSDFVLCISACPGYSYVCTKYIVYMYIQEVAKTMVF